MNRSDAKAAIACLSPAARVVWDSDTLEFDDVDAAIIVELKAAGLLETVQSWSDRARDVQDALGPTPGAAELLVQLEGEDFAGAISCLEDWTGVELDEYDLDAEAFCAIITDAATVMRATYDDAIRKIGALPSRGLAEAA